MAFWDSWAMWAKLCFVLGILICIVFCIGAVQQYRRRRRTKRFEALQQEQAERGEMAMVEAERRKDEIPFGVRAIQSGIQVEGIWISNPNTPTPSTPASPALTPMGGIRGNGINSARASSSTISHLEIPQPARTNFTSETSPSSVATSVFDKHVGAERLPSRSGSPDIEIPMRGRPAYQPRQQSHLRPPTARSSAAFDALEAQGRRSGTSTYSNGSEEDLKTHRRSDSPEMSNRSGKMAVNQPPPTRYHAPGGSYEQVQSSTVEARPSKDGQHRNVEPPNTHRRSHAAETGQLLPRSRHSGASSDYTPALTPSGGLQQDIADYFTPHQSHPVKEVEEMPAKVSSNPGSPVASDPADVPFQLFVQTHPVPSALGQQILLNNQGVPSLKVDRPYANTQIRRVNSAFEVLPAGTFSKQERMNQVGDWVEGVEGADKRSPKKLQKKRRSSQSTYAEEA